MSTLCLLILSVVLTGQDRLLVKPTGIDPVHTFFAARTRELANRSLSGIETLDDWNRKRIELRVELLEMLGLDPLPEKTDLKPTITGVVETDEIIVENLHFQSRPGLYVTGNFYRPKNQDGPLPTILYVCGHGRVKVGDVSYGNKATYQHHAAWFARHGYCCLIIDTLQLGEIEGIHHGTYREKMWWWVARGYGSAGVEAWNCVRALDYLETRTEVAMSKIGVTGRSGGGIYTWWIAAIDDRPACLVPVAGITDLRNYVVDGCVEGHCDCMFMINTYQWDFPMVAALAAPRPLLLSNTDKDGIFPLDGVVRTYAQVRKIYALHGALDKLGLLVTEGPHKDTQQLRVPAFKWMNRWLKGIDEPITRLADKPFQPEQLQVFKTGLPDDQINTRIQDSFTPTADHQSIPGSLARWQELKREMMFKLQDRCFRGWPGDELPLQPVTKSVPAGNISVDIVTIQSEPDVTVHLLVLKSSAAEDWTKIELTVANDSEWRSFASGLASVRSDLMPDVKPSGEAWSDLHERVERAGVVALVLPRGIGPGTFSTNERELTHIWRRFVLVGRTLDDGRVWDVRRAIQYLNNKREFAGVPLHIEGEGQMAGIALYAGLFEQSVQQFNLRDLPVSHHDGPIFMNVMRFLDMPQAVALAFPRRVVLRGETEKSWKWSAAVSELYGDGVFTHLEP